LVRAAVLHANDEKVLHPLHSRARAYPEQLRARQELSEK
jgi:hypothetical protein